MIHVDTSPLSWHKMCKSGKPSFWFAKYLLQREMFTVELLILMLRSPHPFRLWCIQLSHSVELMLNGWYRSKLELIIVPLANKGYTVKVLALFFHELHQAAHRNHLPWQEYCTYLLSCLIPSGLARSKECMTNIFDRNGKLVDEHFWPWCSRIDMQPNAVLNKCRDSIWILKHNQMSCTMDRYIVIKILKKKPCSRTSLFLKMLCVMNISGDRHNHWGMEGRVECTIGLQMNLTLKAFTFRGIGCTRWGENDVYHR